MPSKKAIYFPGLNGLRAIAALTVLWGHVFQIDFADWGVSNVLNIPIFGGGVTLFFVISGFLITYLLLEEKQQTTDISIPKFYFRRILRIWPLYYAFIAICILVLYLFGQETSIINGRLWFYILLMANVPFASHVGLPLIVHLWSIGVEEQFYLFWPWVVKHSERLLRYAIIICIVMVIAKYTTYCVSICKFGIGGGKYLIYRLLSVTRFQCMMVGAIGAILFNRQSKFIMFFCKKYIQILLWIFLIAFPFYSKCMPSVTIDEFIAIVSLGLIVGQVSSRGVINLENRVCDFIGKISYGIYVIHPLLLFLLSKLWKSLDFQWPALLQCVAIFTLSISLTVLVAFLSYRYFEGIILRYKTRFAVVDSSNSKYSNDRNRI